ncbi:MAG: hypothetical protein SGARI_006468, partial [Bacillariaceae sp.]
MRVSRDPPGLKQVVLFSDKYDLTYARLAAESVLADEFVKTRNVADTLLFADANKCPLLKEAAIATYKKNPQTVMRSDLWKEVMASNKLLNELLFVTNVVKSGSNNYVASKSNGELTGKDVERLSVSSLRTRLEKEGASVMGDRDELVNRLKDDLNL